ncbi:cytochrome c-type biogenesis protein CcsB [Scopulibacillus darangshiensis]|uniref:Cytochrome c-type biogenesis protein CcsB n=1 Tax=Scopulibacillus darangshiensis TaxID=442528 RepID=A0A4R2PBC0_9BACL|nr:c-type cytochrome biogenesis protein CcsB [Scopulibacillus darangshiensis]TCP31688.1 cytochrome c-type biogenesis protein CcsB [Scopulibacillus darangshiensis]
MTAVETSSLLLLVSFILYTLGSIVFTVSVTGKKFRQKGNESAGKRLGRVGFIITIIGFLSQLGYFFFRWDADGHVPVSNLFEYTTFFSMMMILAFIIIYILYRNNGVGVLTLPIAVVVIAYASVFPREVEPLIPALQSNWLKIHVTTVALGEGILSISFAAGLVYLLAVIDQSKASKKTFWLEFVMYSLVATFAFVIISFAFQSAHYQQTFSWVNEKGNQAKLVYHMPAIAGPHDGTKIGEGFGPLFEAPSWMNGVEAPRKFNTVIWSILGGFILYWIIRLILRRRISAAFQGVLKNINSPLMDEISYRAVAIGFPIFTLGGLVFAAIWAQQAWTRFWGWDPKEVWALITFLFYAAFLHFRLSRGWQGEKSAWLSVIGFVIIMFNLIFVNLVIAGLHSYA